MSLLNAGSRSSVSCSGIWKFKVFSFLPFYFLSHIVVPIPVPLIPRPPIFEPLLQSQTHPQEKKHRSLCIQQWCTGLATGILSHAGMASLFVAFKGQANLLLVWFLVCFGFFYCYFSLTLVLPMGTFFLIRDLHTFTRRLSRTPITLCQN